MTNASSRTACDSRQPATFTPGNFKRPYHAATLGVCPLCRPYRSLWQYRYRA